MSIDATLSIRPQWQILCQIFACPFSQVVHKCSVILYDKHDEQLGFRIWYLCASAYHPPEFRKCDHDGCWMASWQEIYSLASIFGCNFDHGRHDICMGRCSVKGTTTCLVFLSWPLISAGQESRNDQHKYHERIFQGRPSDSSYGAISVSIYGCLRRRYFSRPR